ncbi:MAG: 23S rRNA (adenine(2503)-C(2))-methyltransferase RlmN [Neisseriales bacterium]|nr:MAG: 23S rRNA (adenine(2503)-C(2))-methyltransferase RlmN [Neisseriales bacterium]
MINLLNYSRTQLQNWFASLDEKPFHAGQVMRWIYQHQLSDVTQMSNLSHLLKKKLSALATIPQPHLLQQHCSSDGTCKWLFDTGHNTAIETVFIPEKTRGTLCISSQVGCALKCAFCATGHQGFYRNLTTAEIIGQLWWAKQVLPATHHSQRIISNVVLMGMGEPLANFDALVVALDIMLDDFAYGLSRRRVTVSTAGMVPQIAQLARTKPVALAVSLHAPNDAIRDQLVPLNKKYPLARLMEACEDYLCFAPRDFITFEYVLLAGINDQIVHAKSLIKLLAPIPCKINLIPFNPFSLSSFMTPSKKTIEQFEDTLQSAGFVVTIRKTRGQDIAAACGQLAGRVRPKTPSNAQVL